MAQYSKTQQRSSLEKIQSSVHNKLAGQQIDPKELLRLDMLSSLEKYTKAMFKAQYHRSFAVNEHHRHIFEALQNVVDGKCKRLIINMPPRYSKTETVIKMFTSWCYALNPTCKFLHLSYSDTLVKDNSATIRSIMMEPLYKVLFPNSQLEKEKGSSERWKTLAGGEFYAVSTQGQVTGFGAGQVDEVDESELTYDDLTFDKGLNKILGLIDAKTNLFNGAILIDDPMKPEDADSDIVRERINTRFESTIRNRVNSRDTPIIIIMQRLHEKDLCGYLMEKEPDEWTVLSMPAIQIDENGNKKALWPMKHTVEELERMREINPVIFDTQYMQDPKPKEGLMYPNGFKTYTPDQLPQGVQALKRWNYTDTADTGADSLCSICFIDTPEFLYVTDVLFTNKPMEYTEPMTAQMLNKNRTVKAKIESNNGGRGFGRNIKRILRVSLKNFRCIIEFFTQTENKFSRIYNWSANVQSEILMPEGWDKMWPGFYSAITSYRKDNRRRSMHDDAPDCLTGCYEMHIARDNRKGITLRN